MANEFKVKNGLIVIGDLTTSGTITINGALAATQSWVTSQGYLTSASLSGYATQSYVTSAIAALVDAAPAALDTLNELAAALGDDANFSTTITTSIGNKVSKSGDTMTGSLLFTAVANNVRLEKSGSFLNLLDTYSNIHLYNGGNGIYIDSNVHYWRSQGATYWMTLNSAGLGIGTQSPETKLHVAGGKITLKGGSSTDQQIVYNYAREYVNGIYNSSGHFRLQDNSLAGTVYQWDGSTFAFPNGNIGIGTTSPIYKLQVAGSAYVNGGTLFLDSDQYLRWGNSNQGIVGSNDNHVSIVSGGATRQSIYADGRTYFPGLDLSISNVNSTHGTANYFRGDTSHLVIGTGGTLYLNYGGNSTFLTGSLNVSTSLTVNQGIGQNNLVGRPYAVWGASGTSTGAVVIKFPGNTNNYGMVHAVIDIYEYGGNTVSTIIVGGHNWGSQWYNYGANLVGQTDKQVRVAVVDGAYAIVIGDNSSSWSYGQVVLRKIQNGSYYQNAMNVSEGYTLTQTASLTTSWISGDLRKLTVSGQINASGGDSSQWNSAYSWGNHANAGYLTSVSDVWVNTTGDTMTGNLNFGATSNLGLTWGLNTDAAFIKFVSTGNGAGQSYLEIGTQDDSDEEIKFTQSGNVRFYLATDGFLKNGSGYKYVFENGTWGINISGNAATATTSTTFASNRTNYKGVTDNAVAGQLMWKNYGNNHTIFDASNGTSPDGTSVNNTNSQAAWTGTYPTLMGWNGSTTYGVRVDSARIADTATTATTASALTSMNISQFTNNSGYFGPGSYSWTSPVFGQYGIKSNLIDNVLYSAADRFEVFRDGVAWNTNAPFNLNYDQSCDVIPTSTSRTYSIVLNTKGNGSSGITYTEGNVYLSFYYVFIPGSVSGRVKDQNGTWRNIDNWTNVANSGSYAVWRGNVPSFNYMVEIEITITSNASNNTWFAQWEYVMGRPGQYELGIINKAQDNSLWRNMYFRDSSNNVQVSIGASGLSTSQNLHISGTSALYFPSYGGGFYMQDSSWIRTVNYKSIWTQTGLLGTDGGLTVGYGGTTPPSGGAIISGNVGIGTTSPTQKLHIEGGKAFVRTSNAGWGQFAVVNPVDSEVTLTWAAEGTGYPGIDSTYTRQWIAGLNPFGTGMDRWSLTNKTLGANTAITVLVGGNVGMGTTSPANKLTIQSNSTQLRLETASDPSAYHTLIESNYNSNNPLNIYSSAAASNAMGTIVLSGITGVNTYLNSYYGIVFGTSTSSITASTVRMMITNGGNVGIGTTSPGTKLEVNGGSTGNNIARFTTGGVGGGTRGLTLYSDSSQVKLQVSDNAGGIGTWAFLNLNPDGGNVGIGTTTPQKKLDVFGSAGIVTSIGSNIGPGQFAGLHFGYSESHVNNDSYKKSALVFERTDNHGQGGNASGKIHFLLNNITSTSANALTDSVVTIDSDASATVGSVRMGIGTRNPSRTLDVNGEIGLAGRLIGYGKNALQMDDSWLRLNQEGHFGSGVYTPGLMRADGGFQVSGNTVIHSGTIGSQSVSYANSAGSAGQVTNQSGQLLRFDNRVISPSETTAGYLQFGFTTWGNDGGNPYADYLHMRSYTDASGGNDNLVMFRKDTIGMRIWQQTWGSTTAYASYVDVWTTANFTQTNVNNWNTAYGWGNHASADYIVRGTQIASSASWPTATRFGSVGSISQDAGNHALSVRSEFGNDAFMSFHIGSDYAVHFGLDGVSNRMSVGGWSDGAVKYQLWDTRDFTSTNVSNWNTAYGWGNHASQSYATTSYVTTQINNLIAGAPGALDTLDELAAALGDDASFATTVTNSIAGKVSKSGDTMTGVLNLNGGLYVSPAIDFGRSTYSTQYANIILLPTDNSPSGYSTIEFKSGYNYPSDGASITYKASTAGSGEDSEFLIRLNNDADDHIKLQAGYIVCDANTVDGGSYTTPFYWRVVGDTKMSLSPTGNLTISGFLTESSSLKLKENVETSEGNLEKVVNLRPVTYNKIGSQTTELGLIAEEVAEVYPEFVQYDENGDPIGVNYSRLTAALIGAVKELTNQVQELNKKING